MPNGEYTLDFYLITRAGNYHYFNEMVRFSGATKFRTTTPIKLYSALHVEGYGTASADTGPVNFIELVIDYKAHMDGANINYIQIENIQYYDPYSGYVAQVKNGGSDVSLQLEGAGVDVSH